MSGYTRGAARASAASTCSTSVHPGNSVCACQGTTVPMRSSEDAQRRSLSSHASPIAASASSTTTS
jgi:hypothetical protein